MTVESTAALIELARNAARKYQNGGHPNTAEVFMLSAQEIEKLAGLVEELNALVYAPGDWKCDACGYVESKRILSALDGSVGASAEAALPCPNDGQFMRRLTWKEIAESATERAMKEVAGAKRLREDTERLDWLEDQVRTRCVALHGNPPAGLQPEFTASVHLNGLGYTPWAKLPDASGALRAAIDLARTPLPTWREPAVAEPTEHSCAHCGRRCECADGEDGCSHCAETAADEQDDEIACPVGDPDCLSGDDESHDGCEPPEARIP